MKGNPNLVLTGFMGTGKSSAGRQAASILGLEFVDMDEEIVRREGRPIPDIFASQGEAYFRQVERRVAQDFAARQGLVIATGGGVVLNPDNLRDFRRSGLLVCLTAEPDTILRRIASDHSRPLLFGDDKKQKVMTLLESRRALYEAIEDRIQTDTLTLDQVVEELLMLYRAFRGCGRP